MSIRNIFFQGIRWTALASAFNLGLGLIQVAILSRSLALQDFAWVAIVAVFINLGLHIQNTSVNTAIIQKSKISPVVFSTLYWINIFLGFILTLISLFIAFLLSLFYESKILFWVTLTYSLIYPINAMSVQYKTLLQKNFQFNQYALAEIGSSIGAFSFAIWAAIQGWGAFALTGSYVMRYFLEAVFIIPYGLKQFKPNFTWNWKAAQPFINFGKIHLMERTFTNIISQADVLIIGKMLGNEALGIYDVIKRILVRPLYLLNDIFERITFPLFAQYQNEIPTQRSIYHALLSHLAAINFPILLFLIITAKPFIAFFLGPSWQGTEPIFQIMCLSCMVHFLLNPIDTLLLSRNKILIWLKANIAFLPVLITLLVSGSNFSLWGAAFGYVIAHLLFFILVHYLVVAPILQINAFMILHQLKKSFVTSIVAAFVTNLLAPYLNFWLLGIVFFGIYGLLTWIFNRAILLSVIELFKLNS